MTERPDGEDRSMVGATFEKDAGNDKGQIHEHTENSVRKQSPLRIVCDTNIPFYESKG